MIKTFKIDGMVCEGCASAVKELISSMPEVSSVEVNLSQNLAEVNTDEDLNADDIQKLFVKNNKSYQVTKG